MICGAMISYKKHGPGSTVDEINTSTFIIERSTNGTGFMNIGSVTAVGSGNNSYSDTNTPLRLLDLNGRLITEQVITTQQQRIDLSGLSHGVYLSQFANGSTLKVLKE